MPSIGFLNKQIEHHDDNCILPGRCGPDFPRPWESECCLVETLV